MANSAVDVADMRDLVGLARHPLPNKCQDGTGEMLKDCVSGEHDLAKAEQEQEQKDGGGCCGHAGSCRFCSTSIASKTEREKC